MTNNNKIDPEVLTESESARQSAMSDLDDKKSVLKLYKVEKSIDFKKVDTNQYMTTSQVANLYQVGEEAIKKLVNRHKEELESDGLRTLRGKELKSVSDKMSLSNKARNATLFTPRSVLRVGMLLRDSEVAKNVRSTLLDITQAVSQKPLWLERLGQFQERNQWKYPSNYFSVFEMAIPLLNELESKGCPIPDNMIPDISIGKHWSQYLRKEKGVDPDSISVKYTHEYPDGRKAPNCRAYMEDFLIIYRRWFREHYRPHRLAKYIADRKESTIEEKVEALKAISQFPDVDLSSIKMPKAVNYPQPIPTECGWGFSAAPARASVRD